MAIFKTRLSGFPRPIISGYPCYQGCWPLQFQGFVGSPTISGERFLNGWNGGNEQTLWVFTISLKMCPKNPEPDPFWERQWSLDAFFWGDMEMNQNFGVFFLFCSYPWDDLTWFFGCIFIPFLGRPSVIDIAEALELGVPTLGLELFSSSLLLCKYMTWGQTPSGEDQGEVFQGCFWWHPDICSAPEKFKNMPICRSTFIGVVQVFTCLALATYVLSGSWFFNGRFSKFRCFFWGLCCRSLLRTREPVAGLPQRGACCKFKPQKFRCAGWRLRLRYQSPIVKQVPSHH